MYTSLNFVKATGCRTALALIPVLSLPFTYLFFFEYLPPFKTVHIPYYLERFHYPLMNYALQALRQARLPEWDARAFIAE